MQAINTVILIDDDPVHNFLITKILLALRPNWSIIEFTSASEGLMFISGAPAREPVIVLLDLNMPEMSGWDFLNQFDALSDEVKKMFVIYIVSSSIDSRELERATENPNVTDFINKPLTRKLLSKLPIARQKQGGRLILDILS